MHRSLVGLHGLTRCSDAQVGSAWQPPDRVPRQLGPSETAASLRFEQRGLRGKVSAPRPAARREAWRERVSRSAASDRSSPRLARALGACPCRPAAAAPLELVAARMGRPGRERRARRSTWRGPGSVAPAQESTRSARAPSLRVTGCAALEIQGNVSVCVCREETCLTWDMSLVSKTHGNRRGWPLGGPSSDGDATADMVQVIAAEEELQKCASRWVWQRGQAIAQDRTEWCQVSASLAAHTMSSIRTTFVEVRSASDIQ